MSMLSAGGAGGRRRGRGGLARSAPMAEINVTPLVDVMLVLLVIFMVTAPLLSSAVPVSLPDGKAQPLDSKPEMVTLSMDKAGALFLDAAPVAEADLPARLAERNRGGKPPAVTLRADRGLPYGDVARIMAGLGGAGITQISLVTSGSSPRP